MGGVICFIEKNHGGYLIIRLLHECDRRYNDCTVWGWTCFAYADHRMLTQLRVEVSACNHKGSMMTDFTIERN